MRHSLLALVLLPLLACRSVPQRPGLAAGATPLYEVRLTPSRAGSQTERADPGLLELEGWTLTDLVGFAYRDSRQRVECTFPPSDQRYDVHVRMPTDLRDPGPARGAVRGALSDAFGIASAEGTVSKDVYFLRSGRAKGPRLKRSASRDGAGGGGGSGPEGGSLSMENGSMAQLAGSLEMYAKRPVIDSTGLEGGYDLSLEWDPRQEGALERAVAEQLGLRLEPGTAEVDVLLVGRAP